MAEKDVTERLRRAVKENNLFLVKRLIQRTEMRNIDPAPKRYTSLAWAAVLGHEETFEFLLIAGHDDEELSKDSENNTILMLLADNKPPLDDPYAVRSESPQDRSGATMRMARLYYDRYPWILDWSNAQGKTALHIASTNGNEELVRMLCDFDADFDLADNKGNTALHYASSWNSLPVVRLLIERGCQYTARNNEGYTASDYAYSSSTRDTLQDTARLVFEQNKKARRQVFAQAAEKGDEWGRSAPIPMSSSNSAARLRQASRVRSGSGTSRSGTGASETGEVENGITTGPLSRSPHSSSASPPHHVGRVNGLLRKASGYLTGHSNSNGPSAASGSGQGQLLNPPKNSSNALSPVTTRMLERDADAMEKYNQRNRSGSSSTDNRSQNGSNYSSAGPSTHGDELAIKNHLSGATTPRRLRPSASAAQLRTIPDTNSPPLSSTAMPPTTQSEQRHRAGTTPVPRTERPSLLARTSSTSTSPPSVELFSEDPNESYIGPPSQYAHFPDPPQSIEDGGGTPTNATANRRKGFHILSKPLPGLDQHLNGSHRRGPSAAASVRGA